MELNLEPPQSRHSVRRVTDEAVVVGDKALHHSFVLTAGQLLEDWPERAVEDIDEATVSRLLAIEPRPEVILLGSGPRQLFVAPRIQADVLQRGIGLECMDNAACARTFNLLVNEGRHVAAVFLLP